jgi:N12 class adenine-specific DNA methylase
LLQLRDGITSLLQAEAASLDDTAEIDQLRKTLNDSYDAYLRTYGPLNRFSEKGHRPVRRERCRVRRPAPATGDADLRR